MWPRWQKAARLRPRCWPYRDPNARPLGDPGLAGAAEDVGPQPEPDPAPPSIAPAAGLSIPPAPVAEVVDHLPVLSPAALAAILCPTEADRHRQLAASRSGRRSGAWAGSAS
jgi:hypothetical protein